MSKTKYLIPILILSLLCPLKIKAACTEEEKKEFKKIEDEYKITYEFDTETKDYNLFLYFPKTNLYSYAFTEEMFNKMELVENSTNVVKYPNVNSGNHEFYVVGKTSSCNEVLKTIEIKLPKYNKYSEDPLCNGIEEFVLCHPTYDKDIDYETFVSRVNSYKKKLEKEEQQKTDDIVEEDDAAKTIKYIKENLLQIIIIAVFVIVVIITTILTFNSIKKSRRLE